MAKDKLATFRVDGKQWELFKEWARANDSTAARELNNYISHCLGTGKLEVNTVESDRIQELEKSIYSYIDTRIQEITDLFETRLSDLESNLQDHSRIDYLPKSVKPKKKTSLVICPYCNGSDVIAKGYSSWIDKATGEKKIGSKRQFCKDCRKSFSS